MNTNLIEIIRTQKTRYVSHFFQKSHVTMLHKVATLR